MILFLKEVNKIIFPKIKKEYICHLKKQNSKILSKEELKKKKMDEFNTIFKNFHNKFEQNNEDFMIIKNMKEIKNISQKNSLECLICHNFNLKQTTNFLTPVFIHKTNISNFFYLDNYTINNNKIIENFENDHYFGNFCNHIFHKECWQNSIDKDYCKYCKSSYNFLIPIINKYFLEENKNISMYEEYYPKFINHPNDFLISEKISNIKNKFTEVENAINAQFITLFSNVFDLLLEIRPSVVKIDQEIFSRETNRVFIDLIRDLFLQEISIFINKNSFNMIKNLLFFLKFSFSQLKTEIYEEFVYDITFKIKSFLIFEKNLSILKSEYQFLEIIIKISIIFNLEENIFKDLIFSLCKIYINKLIFLYSFILLKSRNNNSEEKLSLETVQNCLQNNEEFFFEILNYIKFYMKIIINVIKTLLNGNLDLSTLINKSNSLEEEFINYKKILKVYL